MSRFTLCNCPVGFSAAPERHAPDCPGRFGAGKPSTAVVKPTILKETNVGYAASSGAPVPPAGDVEVIAIGYTGVNGYVRSVGQYKGLPISPMDIALVDRVHVTRLTAELKIANDRLRIEVDTSNKLGAERDDWKARCARRVEDIQLQAQRHEQTQSELTKVRELIERGELAGAFGRFPDLSADVKQYLAPQSAPAGPGKTLREELGASVEEWAGFKEWLKAKETAPIAKDSSDEDRS